MARNADRIRKHIRADNGGLELHVPYSQGTGRALPRGTAIRREVLGEIMADLAGLAALALVLVHDILTNRR